jgi:hypothetical protein
MISRLDRFLALKDRRLVDSQLTLFSYVAKCPSNCGCSRLHAPKFTGVPNYRTFPPTEGHARKLLLAFLPAWPFATDHSDGPMLPNSALVDERRCWSAADYNASFGHESLAAALSDFVGYGAFAPPMGDDGCALISPAEHRPRCPPFLRTILESSRAEAELRDERAARRKAKRVAVAAGGAAIALETGYDSDADDDMPGQFAPGETGSAPDDAALVRMRKGLVDAMDVDDAAAAAGDDGDDLLPPAYVGPPGFDWHAHALEGCTRGGTRLLDAIEYEAALDVCLKLLPEAAKKAEAADLAHETGAVELPVVSPLSAVGNQRLAIALPLVRALAKRLQTPVAHLRMFLIGGAGTGKSFVGKVNSRIARRLGGRNRAVLNVAPTGAACKQQVDGRTLASVMPLPRGEAARKSDEVAGGGRGGALSLPKRSLIHSLIGAPGGAPHTSLLIVDEVFMNGLPQFAMASERLNEARDLPEGEKTFGGIDTVIIQGDPGQLPAIGEDLELFERPPPTRLAEHPLEALGAVIYRHFDHAVMLDVSQRQKNLEMIQRLARLRMGHVTAADAAFYNSRALPNLPPAERALFDGSSKNERVVTVVSNYEQAAAIQHGVQEQLRDQRGARAPVAVMQQPGRGKTGRAAAMCCQVPLNVRFAQGEPVMLSKSVQEGKLVRFGLYNGNVGIVVAFLYRKGCAPPAKPVAILVDYPAYTGPRAHADWPATWVPIIEEGGMADQTDGSTRRGFPLVSGAAIVGHKMQGVTIGVGEDFTKVRFLLEDDVGVEAKNCGYTYVLFSRPKEDGDWCMMHAVVERRFTYINGQEALIGRSAEIERLAELAARTKACNPLLIDPTTFTALLRRCDELAADGHQDGVCAACKAGTACEPMCAACEVGACVRPMAEWASCDCVVCHRLRELDAAGIASLVQAAPEAPPPLLQRRGGARGSVSDGGGAVPVAASGVVDWLKILVADQSWKQLSSACSAAGLPHSGTKAALLERLRVAQRRRQETQAQPALMPPPPPTSRPPSPVVSRVRATSPPPKRSPGPSPHIRQRLLPPPPPVDGDVAREAAALRRALLQVAFESESESLEVVGVTVRRFFPARVRLHLLDRQYAECPQLKAMAAHFGVDIAAIDAKDRFDQCSLYTADGARDVQDVGVSWRETLSLRLLRQHAGEQLPIERPLIVLVWNGKDHFDAAVPAGAGQQCAPHGRGDGKPERDAMLDEGGLRARAGTRRGAVDVEFEPTSSFEIMGGNDDDPAWRPQQWPSAAAMLAAAGLEFVRVPGDGACAYWAVLLTVGKFPRTFFAGGRQPFDEREPADEAALDLMRALRLAVVSWLVAPEQRALLRSEPGITLSFEEYVRGCS